MTTFNPTPNLSQTVELAPRYTIPIFLIIGAIPLVLVQPWVSLIIALLGLFLLIQTVAIRLQFTATDLDVYRSSKLLRRFPYKDWSNWEIYWNRVPILFYFREVKSIHFLPIIFDVETLKTCLEQRCPKQSS